MATNDAVQNRKKARSAAGRPWRLRFNVLAGAAADANIPVTGIETDDQIVFCCIVDTGAVAASGLDDVTDETNITSAGNIQHDITSSAAKLVLLAWYDVRP
jgi:hypothetical protein